jgi:hypothetical protein
MAENPSNCQERLYCRRITKNSTKVLPDILKRFAHSCLKFSVDSVEILPNPIFGWSASVTTYGHYIPSDGRPRGQEFESRRHRSIYGGRCLRLHYKCSRTKRRANSRWRITIPSATNQRCNLRRNSHPNSSTGLAKLNIYDSVWSIILSKAIYIDRSEIGVILSTKCLPWIGNVIERHAIRTRFIA